MTNRIDPTGNWVQTTHRKPMIDRVFGDPKLQKLPPRNHTVLSSRQFSNKRIDPLVSSPQPAYTAG